MRKLRNITKRKQRKTKSRKTKSRRTKKVGGETREEREIRQWEEDVDKQNRLNNKLNNINLIYGDNARKNRRNIIYEDMYVQNVGEQKPIKRQWFIPKKRYSIGDSN